MTTAPRSPSAFRASPPHSNAPARVPRSAAAVLGLYALAVAAVALALGATLVIRSTTDSPTFFAFYAAIFATIWFAGRGPGLLTLGLSSVALYALLHESWNSMLAPREVPTLFAFALSALTAELLRAQHDRSQRALKAAGERLEAAVKDRTEELRRANEELRRDIARRKELELERRRLAFLVEQADDLMAIADLSGGTPIYLNKAGLKMVGFDSWEEARTRRGIHYVFPVDRPFINEVVWPAVLEKGSWSGEMRFRHFKTGEPIPLLYSAFRIDDPETGQPVNVGNVCRDISARKRAEQALRTSEERWRSIFENSAVGVATGDEAHRYTSANRAFQQMLGYDEEEILQLGPLELTHEDDRAIASELLAEILTGRRQSYQVEKRLRRKDGAFIWASVYCSRVPGTDMTPDFYQAVVIDVTERKRAEAEASESERRYREVQMELAHSNRVTTMGQLAASIAHEVNQPITAILTNAQVAQRWLDFQPPELEEVQQALGRIVNDGTRAGDVTARIRDLIKKTATRKDPLDINAAIREVIKLTHAEAVKNDVSVRTQLALNLPLIEGDRVELQQVMLNLIVNSIEAMSEAGDGDRDLLITTEQTESDTVRVAVKDSGPGLAAKSLERAFDSFYTTKPGGMGMGLSICRSIIEAHGGRLWASANVPRGAVFQFTLPTRPGEA